MSKKIVHPFQNAMQRIDNTESWDLRRNPVSGAGISEEQAAKWGLTSSPEHGQSARQTDSWQHVLEGLVNTVPDYILKVCDAGEKQKKQHLCELVACLENKLVSRHREEFIFNGNVTERELYAQVLGACVPILHKEIGFEGYCRSVLNTAERNATVKNTLEDIMQRSAGDVKQKIANARNGTSSHVEFFSMQKPATPAVTAQKPQTIEVNASTLKKIVGTYKSSSLFGSSNPGPELAAIRNFLSNKKDDEKISIKDIQIEILKVSTQSGSKAYRAELLLHPSKDLKTHAVKDDTGVDRVIRALGKAFLQAPVPALTSLR